MQFLEWLKTFISKPPSNSSNQPDELDDLDLNPDHPFPEPIEIEITDVIDLHTIQPREIKAVVEEYLTEAHARGFRSVRIIHGKGIGVQREIVHSILGRTSFVSGWKNAPSEGGGWGATIVNLKD